MKILLRFRRSRAEEKFPPLPEDRQYHGYLKLIAQDHVCSVRDKLYKSVSSDEHTIMLLVQYQKTIVCTAQASLVSSPLGPTVFVSNCIMHKDCTDHERNVFRAYLLEKLMKVVSHHWLDDSYAYIPAFIEHKGACVPTKFLNKGKMKRKRIAPPQSSWKERGQKLLLSLDSALERFCNAEIID